MFKKILLFALTLALFVSASTVVSGQEIERTSDDQTAWWWYTGVSIDALGSAVNEHGARLIDIEIDSASPLRLSASMVRNAGSYASGWWWYVGIDAARLSEILDDLSARIIDIEAYEVGGALRYAVILVPNTGLQAKAWWWLTNVSFDDLSTFVSRNNARILDLEAIEVNGRTTYAAVMVRNTGSDAAAWWCMSAYRLTISTVR